MTDSSWIHFIEITEDKRKTKIFEIRTKEFDILLGEIKWFGAWRCYVFYPAPETIFEKTCMQDIIKFIDSLMLQRKLKIQGIEHK